MSFLGAPYLLLLAVVPPAIVLLYFLKLRREEQVVSSTLLWRRAVEDLRVNAPWQRLRRNLLLLLQILVVLFAILALAQPVRSRTASRGRSVVILIDTSASMGTRDEAGRRTRFEEARRRALAFLEGLDWSTHAIEEMDPAIVTDDDRERMAREAARLDALAGSEEIALVAFDRSVRVVSGFTRARARIADALRSLEARDAETDLARALEVADGLAAAKAEGECTIVLFSDGAFGELVGARPVRTPIQFYRLGRLETDNVAVTGLSARRRLSGPGYEVFCRVEYPTDDADARERNVVVDLTLGEAKGPQHTRGVTLAPNGSAPLLFESDSDAEVGPDAVEVRVSLDVKDNLAADNRAWAVIPPQRRIEVLVYGGRNTFLDKALAGLPGARVRRRPASALPGASEPPPEEWAARAVVVFDGCAPGRLGEGGGYLFLNAIPPLPGGSASRGAERKAPTLVSWDTSHPVTRFLTFADVELASASTVALGPGARPLVETEHGPVVAALERGRMRLVATGFDILHSNWPLRVSFPLFVANAAAWLADAGARGEIESVPCGEAIEVEATLLGGARRAELESPDGRRTRLAPRADRPAHFSDTGRAGLYRIRSGNTLLRSVPVNLLSPTESRNAARESFSLPAALDADGEEGLAALAGRNVEIRAEEGAPAAQEAIWKVFALAALALLLVEWFVYHRKTWI